jgi:hypothetical protein
LLTGTEHDRRNQNPGPSGASPRIATGASSPDERADLLALGGADERAHLRLVVERIAHAQRADGLLQRLHEAVQRAALHEDPRARAAVLPGIAEHASGAIAAACSRSASAKTTFALLPPSSR